MATTTMMSSEIALHSDMRSAHRAYKRDKDSSAKWARGSRRLLHFYAAPGEVVQMPYKMRPKKRDSELPHPISRFKSTNSSRMELFPCNNPDNPVNRRIARKNDAIHESTTPSELAQSLMDMLPTNRTLSQPKIISVPPSAFYESKGDEGASYSFETSMISDNKLGLESLIDEAEKQFITGETERIVREEWQTIDEQGQIQRPKSKKGKKTRVAKDIERKQGVAIEADEDGWEVLSVCESEQ